MTPSRTLTALLLACSIAGVAWAEEKSWVGKAILVKKNGIKIFHTDQNTQEKITDGVLTGIDYKVLAEQAKLIRVRQNGIEGWFEKTDAVLLEDAVEYFTGRIRQNEKDGGAYVSRAMAWKLKGELDMAIKDSNEAVRLSPTQAASWNNRGSIWSAKQEYDRAIKDYDEAIRLDPKHATSFNNRGNAWLGKREYDRAIKDYDEAIHLDPKFVFAFNNRGDAWRAKQEYDRAIKDYDEAIRLDPKDGSAFRNRGNAWRGKREYDRALQDYDEAVRLNPKDDLAFFNRAGAWHAKKEYGKTIKDFDEVVRLNPKDALALSGLAWLRATCPESKYRDGAKAVELARRACELTGWKQTYYLGTLAAAYAEAGQFDEAVRWQEKVLADKDYEKRYGAEARKRLQLYKEKKPYRDE